MPTRGKFLNIGKAHVKRKCKARNETLAVESEGLGGRMEGGKVSDSRYRNWLNSSNLKKMTIYQNIFVSLKLLIPN